MPVIGVIDTNGREARVPAMLLVRPGRALFIPVLLTSFTGAFLAAALAALVREPSVRAAVGALLFGAMFVGFSRVRGIVVRDDALVVHGLHHPRKLVLARTAMSVRVTYGLRGHHTYTVYASDGVASADLSDHSSVTRADAALARLDRALLPATREEPAIARELAASRDAWERGEQYAKDYVAAHYRFRPRRLVWTLLVGLATWLFVLAIQAWMFAR